MASVSAGQYSWIGCCIGSSSEAAFLSNLLLGIGSAEMAVYSCHTAQHHIPKDNVDNLKSLKFNVLFLSHTVTVYLNQIITKCGCVVGILALFGSSQVQISVWRQTVLPAFCTVFLSSSKQLLDSRGHFFYHHTVHSSFITYEAYTCQYIV